MQPAHRALAAFVELIGALSWQDTSVGISKNLLFGACVMLCVELCVQGLWEWGMLPSAGTLT